MATKKTGAVYEVSFHLIPTDTDTAEKEFEEIKGVIVDGGEVISAVSPERVDFAYTIQHSVRGQDGSYNKYNEAYFGSVKFRSSREFLLMLEKKMRTNERVLRFLLLETVEEDTRIGQPLPGDDEPDEGDRAARSREYVRERRGRHAKKEESAPPVEGKAGVEKNATERATIKFKGNTVV